MAQPEKKDSPFVNTLNLIRPILKPFLRGLRIKFDLEQKSVVVTQKAERQEIPFDTIEKVINGEQL